MATLRALIIITLFFSSQMVICATQSADANNDEQKQIAAVDKTLNALHHFASVANPDRYFSLFHQKAIYIGTDASETWNLDEFKSYVEPYFKQGKGWTYTPEQRHVYLSDDKNTAWFDEILRNEKYGISRGTGVLVNERGEWKIAQYHLTFPIPNALAEKITQQIKNHSRTEEKTNAASH